MIEMSPGLSLCNSSLVLFLFCSLLLLLRTEDVLLNLFTRHVLELCVHFQEIARRVSVFLSSLSMLNLMINE